MGAVFDEDRIFRIDHYLGKETVQNLIALRFANTLFEPLWNNLTIDHVQITVAETEGVGDRWPYYDEYGALRDMLQNHMLQLLCLVAMEPPADLDPDSVRNEKVKVLRSLRRFTRADAPERQRARPVRAGRGRRQGRPPATRAERGQATGTETFVALRADIDNWRWAGRALLPAHRQAPARAAHPDRHPVQAGAALDLRQRGQGRPGRQPPGHRPAAGRGHRAALMNKAPGLSQGGMRLQSLPLSLRLLRAYEGPGARRRIAYERLLLDVHQRQHHPVRPPRRGGGGLALGRRRRRRLGRGRHGAQALRRRQLGPGRRLRPDRAVGAGLARLNTLRCSPQGELSAKAD